MNGGNLLPCSTASLQTEIPHFPTLSWRSPDSTLVREMLSAIDGVMLIEDISIQVPMASVRNIFCKLYQDPSYGKHLNKLDSKSRGPYKSKAFIDDSIDQKIILDLTQSTIQSIYDTELKLCPDSPFVDILEFYNDLQHVISRLVRLTASVIQGEMTNDTSKVEGIHYGMNHTIRLVDYFPVQKTTQSQRCGPHRDISTFTLVFQDKLQGGLEVFHKNKWIPVPASSEVVLMWGWSTFILSNGRIPAPLHRVTPIKTERNRKAPRRNEAVLFVMPDWDAYLHPVLTPFEKCAFHIDSIKNLTVREFKTRFEAKWHQREGTTTEQEEELLTAKKLEDALGIPMTQDDEIFDFLLGFDGSGKQIV